MKMVTEEQALHLMAAYCSKAERCIFDVKRKLSQWAISEVDQTKILSRLTDEKFIDEGRFCRAFVNDKSKYNHWGAYKIQYELKKKQIPDSLIRESLEAIVPEENQSRLLHLLETKRKSIKGRDEFEIRQKLMRFAAGRGFSLEEIEKVMKRMKE